jgi:Ca2+-binding RTX toxin-like protein
MAEEPKEDDKSNVATATARAGSTVGAGEDRVIAAAHNDWVDADDGHDLVAGGEGNDLIRGEGGDGL